MAGTANSECAENADDFCFQNKRYLLFNPACMHDAPRRLEPVEEEEPPRGLAEEASTPKKARRVCFDVYD